MNIFRLSPEEERECQEFERIIDELSKDKSFYEASPLEMIILMICIILMVSILIGGLLLK